MIFTNSPMVISSIPASAPSQMGSDFSTYVIRDDFASIAQNTAITTATALTSEVKWGGAYIGAAGTGTFRQASLTDGIHFGAAELFNATATSGLGACMFLGGGSLSPALLNPSSAIFDYKMIFKLGSATNIAFYSGFVPGTAQTTIPSAGTAVFCGFRLDTSLGDTAFSFVRGAGATQTVAATSVAADTNWHTIRVRSVVAGTVLYSIDGGAETAVTTNLPNTTLDYAHQIINRTTASAVLTIDAFGMQIKTTRT